MVRPRPLLDANCRMTGQPEIEVQPSPTVPLRPRNRACNVQSRLSHIIMMLPRRGNVTLVRYFRRPSRIEQLRSSTGGHLLEGFAKELSQGRYQWVAARKHIRAAEQFLHWIAHRNLSITSVEERYAQQFLDHLKRCCCRGHHPPLEPHRQKYSVDLWFVYLRRAGIVPPPTFVEPAVEATMLVSFCDWMRQQRGASDATLSIYRFELRAFIKKLGEEPRMYDARNLRQFVLDKS